MRFPVLESGLLKTGRSSRIAGPSFEDSSGLWRIASSRPHNSGNGSQSQKNRYTKLEKPAPMPPPPDTTPLVFSFNTIPFVRFFNFIKDFRRKMHADLFHHTITKKECNVVIKLLRLGESAEP